MYKIDFINSSFRRYFQQHRQEVMAAVEKCFTNGDFFLPYEVKQF